MFLNRDVRKRDHLYINDEKLGHSYTFSLFLRKGGGGLNAEKGGRAMLQYR